MKEIKDFEDKIIKVNLFNGERMEVYTSTSYIEAKTALEVEAIEGNKVRVKVINN